MSKHGPMDASLWDRRYAKSEFAYGKEPNAFLQAVEESGILKNKFNVLCICEGEGRNAVYLASKGHFCKCVDLSAVGLKKAQRYAQEKNVDIEIEVSDVFEFDMGSQKWDAIVSIFAHVPKLNRDAFHQRCIDALRPNGVLVFEGFSKSQLRYKSGGPPDEARLFSVDDVAEEFAGLRFCYLVERTRDVTEGKYHTGIGSVIQAIGFKQTIESKANAEYMNRMDRLFLLGRTATSPAMQRAFHGDITNETASIGYHEKDKLLCTAFQSNSIAIKASIDENRCRYCWLPSVACFCERIENWSSKCPGIHFTLLCHPQEFLRSTSTGKLCAQMLGGEFLVFGWPEHEERLQELLRKPNTHFMFPIDGSVDAIKAQTLLMPSLSSIHQDHDDWHIILPDGTWKQARALLDICRRIAPNVGCIHLNAQGFSERTSPIIEAVHPGFGIGRMSTFEACIMFLRDLETLSENPESEIANGLEAMISSTKMVRKIIPQESVGPWSIDQAGQKKILDMLQREVADQVYHQADMTYCCVCGITLATPIRLHDHVRGRKHCENTFAHMLQDEKQILLLPNEKLERGTLIELFRIYSAEQMKSSVVSREPGDIAFVQLFTCDEFDYR